MTRSPSSRRVWRLVLTAAALLPMAAWAQVPAGIPAASTGAAPTPIAGFARPATAADPTVGPGSRTDLIQQRAAAQGYGAAGQPAAAPAATPAAPAPRTVAQAPAGARVPGIMDTPRGRPPLENDVAAQMDGKYPPLFRDRDPTVPLADLQAVWSDPSPAPGQVAPGILKLNYARDRTVTVRTRQYMATTIRVPPCEVIEQAYLGDRSVFKVIQPRDDSVVVQPGLAGADTNLTIVTESGNAYTFYLRSEGTSSQWVPDLAVYVEAPWMCTSAAPPGRTAAQWGAAAGGGNTWDPVALRRPARDRAGDFVRGVPFDASKLSCDGYKVFGREEADRAIAPLRVCDDGVFVYFDFGDKIDQVKLPVVHAMSDSVDQPVNTRMTGDRRQILVAEVIADVYTLKTGQRMLCVRRVKPSREPTAPVQIDANLGRSNGFFASFSRLW